MTLQRCPRCGEHKPFSEFPPAPSRPHGIASFCRPCHRDNMRRIRATPEGRAATDAADRRFRERRRARLAATSSLDVTGNQPLG